MNNSKPKHTPGPTLEDIRNATTFEALKPAIEFLCDVMQNMTWSEYNAYKRTLETQAAKVGASLKELNDHAENYQVFGRAEHLTKATGGAE